jgi:hypothetical protein
MLGRSEFHTHSSRNMLIKDSLIAKHPDDKDMQRALKQQITLKSRDNARTPMQVRWFPRSGEFFANGNSVEQLEICRLLYC